MKHFITLQDVPCWRNIEFTKGKHILSKGLDYITTNAQILSNGDFYFELWDNEGYIGHYVIYKQFLHLIQEINLVELI